ncbi:MAG: response regulator [Sphingomonas sp.]|nr:response regulator [Sphingomonas sp.]
MLHQELPQIDSGASGRLGRWLIPAVVLAAALSMAIVLLVAAQPMFAAIAVAGGALATAFAARRPNDRLALSGSLAAGPDFSLMGAAMGLAKEPAALTDGDGCLLIANAAYRERFGNARPPLGLASDEGSLQGLEAARTMAWRDGAGCAARIETEAGSVPVEVERVGASGSHLLWRFPDPAQADPLTLAMKRAAGVMGERLASAGIMVAVIDANRMLLSGNQLFDVRALGVGQDHGKVPFRDLIRWAEDQRLQLRSEGDNGPVLRGIYLPLDPDAESGAGTFLILENGDGTSLDQAANVQALLDVLPVGLALVDRDGRFLTLNQAFRQAAGLGSSATPVYPGDLVVKEDKAAVADAVRRNARGPAMSGDLAIRLARQPLEPVALTIAGLRGLGDAVVLLLLKDNSEEAKLKRQVAQATKMQVVGQLAGGVAHDFNNILTAIIGHCDLMQMRHTPGDSDYDDIQQIKSNSNRAAGLTRQLLAFSRQQTLRPQVLQLPDVVSEVSHLLKRLLGETVQLVVKHGRNLGPVRADPGQLEQVIVNLAVNARDAIASKGSGVLTIQSYSVRADQVAELGSDILPVDDYSALSVADTGCGIAANVLGKIFEPFFTTKEVGKGTGLGLSTVYGIVKQSGGFIFADSKVGEGTRFVIYLPVFREDASAAKARVPAVAKKDELWGSGNVLLVEDEPTVRSVAERALSRHGYSVVTADNGEEALEILSRGDEFVLLISDVVMPGMDGPTMVAEARKSRPDLKILFMSGYAEEQLRNSIDIQNVNFLAKPFSVTDLAQATRRAIGPK